MSNQELKCVCGNSGRKVEIVSDCHGSVRVECLCGISGPWFNFLHLLGEDDYLTAQGEIIADKEAVRLWVEMQNKLAAVDKTRAVLAENDDLLYFAREHSQNSKFAELLVALADALEGGSNE